MTHSLSPDDPARLRRKLMLAVSKRTALWQALGQDGAARMFSGEADGVDGVYIDVYGPGAVMIVYEGRPPRTFDPAHECREALDVLSPLGVRAVYLKPFMKDRSKLGGELPPVVTEPTPEAGETLPEFLLIREGPMSLEVRLWDGLSTGLFLDQRDNRAHVRSLVAKRAEKLGRQVRVLNTFAYTCAFSVSAALGGASTTSVDVSARYLDWGKRNFAHNNIAIESHRFAKMGTMEFMEYAARKKLTYDLIILDPPSYAAGSKKKDVRPWSSTSDYWKLVQAARGLLEPNGAIFASTNTQELCLPGKLEREVTKGLGEEPRWLKLPPATVDFAHEKHRFAACLCAVK